MKKVFLSLLIAAGSGSYAASAFKVDVLTDKLDQPWAVVTAPDNNIWITESGGKIRVFNAAYKELFQLTGFPELSAAGQGGLLDLAFHPNFSENKWIYTVYSVGSGNYAARIVRFTFDEKNKALKQPTVIYEAAWNDDPAHFGSRLAFDSEGYLYASFGERHQKEKAQDLNAKNGKIVRLKDDGSIPADNPFGAQSPVFSYGHRNPQGLAIEPATGRIFSSEHGPTGYDGAPGGDEINWIRAGLNYGWPEISHDKTKAGMETPLIQFTPALAPSGIAFYTGSVFPEWQGNLFVANLRGARLLRLSVNKDTAAVTVEEELLKSDYGRLRDVVTAPDGSLLVVSDMGELIRISK